MSAIIFRYEDDDKKPVPLSICRKCGRQVRIDGHCDCESIFFDRSEELESHSDIP
jgi:hypothetical protein